MRGSKCCAAALLALGACANGKVTFDAEPGVMVDAAVPGTPDAPLAARSLAVDTTADFTADLLAVDDATVESWGAVAPIAWYTGGLFAHASDTGVITDAYTATWPSVQGFVGTGRTGVQWTSAVSWGDGTPPGVGLTNADDWTMWAEGELHLEPGTWSFALLADDHGFVDIATPRTASYSRIVSANWSGESTGTFVATTDGWYPFRYAISDHAGGSGITLRMSGPSTTLAPIARDRLRVRADTVTGLIETAFDDARDTGESATTIDATTVANVDWGMGNPADLGVTSNETFSVRWSGQLRIDTGGAFTFRYASDDGQRLWIDGVKLLDSWDDAVHDVTSPPITLDPGWHDVVIDHSENSGSAAAHLTIATGPELAGLSLPGDRLRPIESRRDRVAPATNHTDIQITDLSTVQAPVAVAAPMGATVTTVDLGYELAHANWGDLVVTLQAPDGATAVVRNRTDAGTTGDRVERFSIASLAGHPAAGTWTLLVQDAAGSNTGWIFDVGITPHVAGGRPPIPATASYESNLHDLGPVIGIDKVSWIARVPPGAGVALRLRTCAEPAACATSAWSAPITTSGSAPDVAAQRYLQYRIDLSSDGDHAAALESLRVDYRTPLPP